MLHHISKGVLTDTQVAWMQVQHVLPILLLLVWLREGSTQESWWKSAKFSRKMTEPQETTTHQFCYSTGLNVWSYHLTPAETIRFALICVTKQDSILNLIYFNLVSQYVISKVLHLSFLTKTPLSHCTWIQHKSNLIYCPWYQEINVLPFPTQAQTQISWQVDGRQIKQVRYL